MPSSAAASTAAEERLNALVLSTPRAAGSSGLRASSAGASAARSTTTPLSSAKASRSAAVVGDGTFEELMKERARIRKEKDEHSIAELRVQMAGMDRSLSTEIKRRIDLNRSAEKSCSAQVSQMEERLSRIIDDRATLLEERLSAVETKVQELNLRLTEERERIPKDIEKRGEELGRMLKLLQSDLATERRDRLSREGRIAKQVEDHRQFVEQLMEEERAERKQSSDEIRREVARINNSKEREGETFEQMIVRELEELRMAMGQEVQERRVEDDEIVAALNRYTENLQRSLADSV